jgi:phosphate-selective porin OprO and OprP
MRTLNLSLRVVTGILLLASAGGPVAAAAPEGASLEQLRILIEAQAAQIEAMQMRLEELESRSVPQPRVEPEAVAEIPPPTRIQWKGAPELTSPDGLYSAKIRGRVLADGWTTSSETDGVDYPSGTTLRGARLGVEGQLGSAFLYKFEGDYAGNVVSVKDAYVRYVGRPGLAITVGNQKPPFSLEHITGLPRTTFMERALPNVFAIPESLGAAVTTFGDRWSLSLGAFGETPSVELDADEGYSVAGRFTFAPLLSPDRLLHLGVSGYHQGMTRASGAGFRIRQRPEVRVFGTRLVDTGVNAASSATAMGLELAGTWGPLNMQGEYMRNQVDYRNVADATFDGAYLQASWFLTGESRPYDAARGIFGRVRPKSALDAGGWGAVEIAARYSTLDLSDGAIQGGTEDNFSLGLNWYTTAHTRFAFNWVYFDVDGNAATLPYGQPAHKGHAFGARAQVDW